MRKYYFTIILILLFASTSWATDRWVDDNGAAAWGDCTGAAKSGAAACSIATANANADDDDVVYMRTGTYSTNIAPINSGSSGHVITFQNYNSEVVTINGSYYGFNITGKDYIIIDGIVVTNAGNKFGNMDTSSDHNIVQNCTFTNCSGWSGISMSNSNYNQILNNTFNGGASGPEDHIYAEGTSSYNLIQGNTFNHARHANVNLNGKGNTQSYNVVRNNILYNPWHTGLSVWWGPEYTLVENNIIYNTGVSDDEGTRVNEDDTCFQHSAKYSIVRKNVTSNARPTVGLGRGMTMNKYSGEGKMNDGNRIYNNVIYNNPGGVRFSTSGDAQTDNVLKNNILYANDTAYIGSTTGWTITNNTNNTTNPQFVDTGDPTGGGFALSATSPFIDSGTYLTQVNDGGGGSGTALVVDDAKYFCSPSSQWGVPNTTDDYIYVVGDGDPASFIVQVIAVNSNTLTLASSQTWDDNAYVYLAESAVVGYYGNAPAQGAYDYTTGSDESAPTPNPATFSSAPSADSTVAVSMTATTGSDATTPIYYSFDLDPGGDSCDAQCGADYGAGGTDSGWQESDTTYTDSGLDVNNCYCYDVTMKDSIDPTNEGTGSSVATVYTLSAVPGAPTLSAGTDDTTQISFDALDENGNPTANPDTQFACQVTGSIPTDSAWQGQWINTTGGVASESEVWAGNATWDALGDMSGFNSNTTFTIQCKAKNEDAEETALGTGANLKTAYPPGTGENETIVDIKLENITINNTP